MSAASIHQWCFEECERQSATRPQDIANMVDALMYCYDDDKRETWVDLVERLGQMVDPEKNPFGFRRQPVTIGGNVIPVFDFYEKIKRLCGMAAVYQITPEEWYQEFETLHPFNDGNGRVGAIMFNYLKGSTLDALVVPPEYQKNAEPIPDRNPYLDDIFLNMGLPIEDAIIAKVFADFFGLLSF